MERRVENARVMRRKRPVCVQTAHMDMDMGMGMDMGMRHVHGHVYGHVYSLYTGMCMSMFMYVSRAAEYIIELHRSYRHTASHHALT